MVPGSQGLSTRTCASRRSKGAAIRHAAASRQKRRSVKKRAPLTMTDILPVRTWTVGAARVVAGSGKSNSSSLPVCSCPIETVESHLVSVFIGGDEGEGAERGDCTEQVPNSVQSRDVDVPIKSHIVILDY